MNSVNLGTTGVWCLWCDVGRLKCCLCSIIILLKLYTPLSCIFSSEIVHVCLEVMRILEIQCVYCEAGSCRGTNFVNTRQGFCGFRFMTHITVYSHNYLLQN